MKGLVQFLVAKIIVLSLASSFVSCCDPSPLQDYCVAVNDINGVYVSGKFCKDPRQVTSNDFYFTGLNIPGNTSNRVGSATTAVDVQTMPGLNTLGVAMARTDLAPGGQVPPHIHPRASELFLVLEGRVFVGFVSSNEDNNRLFSKVLNPGDVFVFPIGLIHFHVNIGKTKAVAFSAAGSQEPGFTTIGNAVFGSSSPIDRNVLAKAFALDASIVTYLQRLFISEASIIE